MKPLTRIVVRVRDEVSDEKSIPIGEVDIPAIGNATIVLDRNAVGDIRIHSANIKQNMDWSYCVDEIEASLENLQQRIALLNTAVHDSQNRLFNLKRYLETGHHAYQDSQRGSGSNVKSKS